MTLARLDQFPIFETSDPEQYRLDAIARLGARDVRVLPTGGHFRAVGHFTQLGNLALGRSAIDGAQVTVDFAESNDVRLRIIQRGAASANTSSQTIALRERQTLVVSSVCPLELRWQGCFAETYFHFNATALDQKLTSLLGAKPRERTRFVETAELDGVHAEGLRYLIALFEQLLDATTAGLPQLVLRELEQSVIVAFLCTNQHNFSDILNDTVKAATPRYVRRVESYIEANWDIAITMEKLVEEAGVSARSIFKSFRQSRGYSPMAFAKMVRLTRSKQFLCAPDETTSVSAVAQSCGFGNLGHFTKDYVETFGERPSETLARAKRIIEA